MYKPRFRCDLHCHTTNSDGNESPRELVDEAARLQMAVVAITDHDVKPPDEVETDAGRVAIAAYAARQGVKLLKGIEFSCDTAVEDVHIVALGCEWSSPAIDALLQFIENSKVDNYQKLVALLHAQGMPMTWEEVLGAAGTAKTAAQVQKKHIFDLMAKKGYVDTWQAGKLLVRDNPAFAVKRAKPAPQAVVGAVHRAGGIAILAHPYLIDEAVRTENRSLSRDQYIERLIEDGLDGIEVAYPYHKTTYKGALGDAAIADIVKKKYSDRVRVLSGGSDYHGEEKIGGKNARRIGECGVSLEYFRQNSLLAKLSG